MKLRVLVILFFVNCIAHAQFKISGVVLDIQKQPLPYVNVYFKNSTNGIVTDFQGRFELTTTKKRGKIEVSFIGYKTKTLRFNSKKNHFTVYLEEDNNTLDEVVIVVKPKKRLRKKENPAYRILKEIWKRKKKNGLKLVSYYQYKKLQTTAINLNNLDTVFLQKIFKKDYTKTIDGLPYNENGINYSIPLYLNEIVSNIYGNNTTNIEREDLEAEKNKGINQEGFVFKRMTNTFNSINIHQNNITIFKKSFVSPISTSGFETYDYVLHDSTSVNNKKFYRIYFFPRRSGDLAFEGYFWVADKNFSITKIKMKVHKDINLNFVRKLSFEKEYTIKDDSIYLPKSEMFTGDFTLTDKDETNKGLTIKKTTAFSHYEFNNALSPSFYTEKSARFKPNQYQKNQSYWNSVTTNTDQKETYQLIESLKKKREIRQITGLLNTLSTGYVHFSPTFQFGKYWNTIVRNSVEGLKIKAGFRSFYSSEDRFRLSGFLGYGTKDKRFKFGLDSKYLISYKPRISVGASYLYDIEQLGGKLLNSNGLNTNVFDPNALFSRGENYFLSFVDKFVLKFDIAINNNLHIGISTAQNNIKSASPTDFSIDYLTKKGSIASRVTDVSTDIYIAYTPGRHVYGFGVEQKFGKNLHPSFLINYRKGYAGILNGSFNYDKLQLKYSQPLLLGKIGVLKTTIDAGKTFGKVPIALLSPIPANQTYWITQNTFSLINYYDFVTDTYISGHFEHHFNGLILNKIPLIQDLKLRSLLTFKTVYGTISDKNIAINRSNIIYAAPTDKLYYEYGIGFENIGYKNIRPLRIDFITRGNHKSINGLSSPKFAIRIGVKTGF